jgi:hypothetical protein
MGWLRRRKKIQRTSTASARADEIIDTCWGLVARAEASKTEVVKWNPAVAAVLGVEPHPVARELVPHPRRDRVLAGEIRNCIAANRAATAELAAAGIVADHVDEIAVALIELRCSLAAARTSLCRAGRLAVAASVGSALAGSDNRAVDAVARVREGESPPDRGIVRPMRGRRSEVPHAGAPLLFAAT